MARIRNIKDLPVIGWREWLKLPDLGVKSIKVKVDTGARSSALHVFDMEAFERDDEEWVKFSIHTSQRSGKSVVESEAKVLEYRSIKSSSGKASMRPVIITNVTLLDETFPVELTLANRDEMGFRMLLGRQAMRRRFLVDPSGSYYNGRPKRKKTRKQKTLPNPDRTDLR